MTAGWYQSPMDPTGTRRWWDGAQWTNQVQSPVQAPPTPPRPRQLASIPHRIAARVADSIIFGIALTFLHQTWIPVVYDEATLAEYTTEWGSLTFPSVLLEGDIAGTALLVSVVVGVLWELYWLLSEGASPGKQLLGLYVLDPTSESAARKPPLHAVVPRVDLPDLADLCGRRGHRVPRHPELRNSIDRFWGAA